MPDYSPLEFDCGLLIWNILMYARGGSSAQQTASWSHMAFEPVWPTVGRFAIAGLASCWGSLVLTMAITMDPLHLPDVLATRVLENLGKGGSGH